MQREFGSLIPEMIARMGFLTLLHKKADDGVHVLLHRPLHPGTSKRRNRGEWNRRDGVESMTALVASQRDSRRCVVDNGVRSTKVRESWLSKTTTNIVSLQDRIRYDRGSVELMYLVGE